MQRPDEQKRQLIIDTAARLFATQPFHKVRLDDIAAAAKLGKGTLYIYFENKEDLYFTLIYEGFGRMVERLREDLGSDGDARALARLRRIVSAIVGFAFQNPHFFELIRTAGLVTGRQEQKWREKGRDLHRLIEETVRRGVERAELSDAHPELTALCLPGMVRSVMLFGPKEIDEETVTEHIVALMSKGILKEQAEHR